MSVAKRWRRWASVVAAALVTACGGGGGGGSSASPASGSPVAEGLYGGALTGSASSSFELLALDDGSYWALYGSTSAGVFFVRSFLHGHGTSSNGLFTSSDVRDFGFAPAASGAITALYTDAPTITGTIAGNGASIGFSGGRIAGTLYVYDTPALLSDIAGPWTLTLLDGETASVEFSAAGTFTGLSSGGCSFSGNATPRASGKNVFDVALTFAGAPCTLAGQTLSGIGLDYAVPAGTRQLLIAVVDSARAYGSAAFGSR